MLDYIRARVPMAYWQQTLPQARVEAMYAKYLALRELTEMSEGPARKARLRQVSRQWPGGLREAELAGPRRCADRLMACAPPHEPVPRATYRLPAIPLWADLHLLLADQLHWRRRGGDSRDLVGFGVWAASDGSGVWPTAVELQRVGGPRLRPRMAYAWLACRAGLELADLEGKLFRYTDEDGPGAS